MDMDMDMDMDMVNMDMDMGLPYKAYNAEQVSAMQVVVVGVHTEMAGYEQVGTLMQGTAGAIEAAGMGPVMRLAIGGRATSGCHQWLGRRTRS